MEKKQHPSYGMIQLSRSSIGGTGTALFGSSIMHNDVIRLTISKDLWSGRTVRITTMQRPAERTVSWKLTCPTRSLQRRSRR